MWAWYLDWAKTARTVIKSKRLRIIMGLSSAANPSTGADQGLDEATDEGDEELDEAEALDETG